MQLQLLNLPIGSLPRMRFRPPKPDFRVFRLAVILFSSVTLAMAANAQGEADVIVGDIGKLLEKYGTEAAASAAKSLPTVIDDVSSQQRAKAVLDSTASTLPKAAFLQASNQGLFRLYVIDSQNVLHVDNAASLAQILESPNLAGRTTLIIDEASALANRQQIETIQSRWALYTVSGIDPPVRLAFPSGSTQPAASTASATVPARDGQARNPGDFVVFGIIGFAVILGLRRFYRDFKKGYQGKT